MPRTTKPLSDTQIRQAKPKASEYNLADGRGLYLRVKPSGSKLWLFNYYRPFSRARVNIGLGTYPALSLADARKTTGKYQGLLAQDIDPQEHRRDEENKGRKALADTFEGVAKKWLALRKTNVSDGYYSTLEYRLHRFIFPKLGKTPISRITAVEMIDVLSPAAKAGKLETIKKVCRYVNEIMAYAVNSGLIQANPLSGIRKAFNSPKVTHLPTIPPSELPELMGRLNASTTKLVTRCLIEWQLHTMVRPGEAAETKWSEVDFKRGIWTIPAERMKMGRAHIVPLTPQTRAILEVLQPLTGNREYVFPSDHDPRASANSQSANRALKRIGFHGRLVSHGLRALASTTLNEKGFDPDVIEAALAHKDKDAIRAAYNRTDYLDKRKKLMLWWSKHIETAASGNMSVSGIRQFRLAS